MSLAARCLWIAALALSLSAAGCTSSHFEAQEMEGPAAMVDDGGQPRLWVLTKQEEIRQTGISRGSSSGGLDWRSDTFYHFAVQAIDPISTKRLWAQRLRTFGDFEAKTSEPSRVIGSSVSAQLLGQEGPRVWLLIGDEPIAVSAHDGSILVDAAGIEAHNPTLKGLLPSEAKHYGFDQGLVLMSADARPFVLRGDRFEAVAYAPAPPAPAEHGQLLASGREELVPTRPFGDPQPRQATLGGQWIGLYSEKEAADIADDELGKNLRYPYTVRDEGSLARRTFWRAKIATVQRFDDRYQRLTDLTPIPDAPTFLKGRFITEPGSEAPATLEGPPSLLVLHSSRMDANGRVVLTRLDENLKSLWQVELPFSETNIVRSIWKWRLPGHIVMVGEKESEDAGVRRREPWLASVALDTGAIQARSLNSLDD